MEGSGSVQNDNGFGSGRPKTIRIRILNTATLGTFHLFLVQMNMAIFRLVFISCFLHILLFSIILLKPYKRRISRILDELKTVPADFCPPQRLLTSMREALSKVVTADAGQTEIHIIARWGSLPFFIERCSVEVSF
jgi:hypothetical protein